MNWLRRVVLFLFLVTVYGSCGFPSEQQVKDEFKVANPTYQPFSAIVGEGDGGATYYHIRYKKPDDGQTYEQVWMYLRGEDNKTKLYHKEQETVVR